MTNNDSQKMKDSNIQNSLLLRINQVLAAIKTKIGGIPEPTTSNFFKSQRKFKKAVIIYAVLNTKNLVILMVYLSDQFKIEINK